MVLGLECNLNTLLKKAPAGTKWNIGGENEWKNIKLLNTVIDLTSRELDKDTEEVRKTITYVKDRPGHDRRYAIDCTKIKTELGWERKMTFNEGLIATIKWYLSNTEWIENIKSVAYKDWINKNYESR